MELARETFGELTPTEEKFFRAVAIGEDVDFKKGDEKNDNPAKGATWGDERTLKADCIFWVCTDEEAKELVCYKELWIQGAKINGLVELSFSAVVFPLYFYRCYFESGINLMNAVVPFLSLSGSFIKFINAARVKIKSSLFLNGGFHSDGPINIGGAVIGGSFSCEGGCFEGLNDEALNANNVTIHGDVDLGNGFWSRGEVAFYGAIIDGDLNCVGSTFNNPGGVAFALDRVKISGGVFLCNGFSARGEVRLLGAEIEGDLDCEGSSFSEPDGYALSTDGINVKRNVYIGGGFKAEGRGGPISLDHFAAHLRWTG